MLKTHGELGHGVDQNEDLDLAKTFFCKRKFKVNIQIGGKSTGQVKIFFLAYSM